MVELDTDRLILCRGGSPFPKEDRLEEDYRRYRTEHEDPECPFEFYHEVVLQDHLAAKHGNPFGYYSILLKSEERTIGHCSLISRLCSPEQAARFGPSSCWLSPFHTLELEIGWAVSLSYRGQGYATEAAQALAAYAFETFRVARLVAFTERSNRASIRVMQRLGMFVDERPDTLEVVGSISHPHLKTLK